MLLASWFLGLAIVAGQRKGENSGIATMSYQRCSPMQKGFCLQFSNLGIPWKSSG